MTPDNCKLCCYDGYDMDAIMMCTTEGQKYLIENKS